MYVCVLSINTWQIVMSIYLSVILIRKLIPRGISYLSISLHLSKHILLVNVHLFIKLNSLLRKRSRNKSLSSLCTLTCRVQVRHVLFPVFIERSNKRSLCRFFVVEIFHLIDSSFLDKQVVICSPISFQFQLNRQMFLSAARNRLKRKERFVSFD